MILLDGLWGSGKSLLAPLVSSLRGVGPFTVRANVEAICHMLASKRMADDVFKFLFLNGVIEDAYDSSIGRGINLRIWDDSSYFRTLRLWEIIKRVTSRTSENDLVSRLPEAQAYFQLTHLLTQSSESLFRVLPDHVTVINIQRDPTFLFNHWEKYLRRWDNDRETTLAFEFRGAKVPFFAEQWAEEWVSLSLADRSALAVARCASYERNALARNGTPPGLVHTVYFAELLRAPDRVLSQLSRTLGRDFSLATKRQVQRLTRDLRHKTQQVRPELIEGAQNIFLGQIRDATSPQVFEEFYSAVQVFETHESLQR